MRIGNLVTLSLLIIGGFAWLVNGLFGFDFFEFLFSWTTLKLERSVYVLLGISALWQLLILPRAIRTGVSDTQANVVRHP
jgi:uncharacterized membrane protein YuzA (DUF378 family)